MKPEESVTLVIPVRNEERFIEDTLASIRDQDYPSDLLEVLVVDGESEDGTRSSVQQVQEQHPVPLIRLLSNPHKTTPEAMNMGVQFATGSVIVLVGGHSRLSKNYVSRAMELLGSSDAACVGGVLRSVGSGRVGPAIARAMSSPFGVGPARFRYGHDARWVDTVAFGAYRREVFVRLGGFDEELVRNQDDEFNFRLTQAGGRILLDPSMHATYYVRGSFRALWRQYFQYGKYKVRVIQKRKGVPSWRHVVPATFVLSLLASAAVATVTGRVRMFGAVAAPYAGLNVIASAASSQDEPQAAPVVSMAFLVMHLSYGFGFLRGLWVWRRHFHEA